MRTCGTWSAYCGGCRCKACVEAARARQRAYRGADLDGQRARERASQAAYRATNPEKIRAAEFEHDHGITPAQRDELLAAQGGGCAICGSSEFGKRGPQMDHDHATGANRGVLDVTCNIGLGAFEDDPDRLRAAARYVERHRGNFKPGIGAGLLY